jgi:hypothetical protein
MGGGSEGGSAASNNTSCAGHASILWSGEVENVWLTSLLFSCLVLVTLTWEYLTERLQHVLEEHGAYKELLEKVYRELTLLGLLSFGLFIKTDTSAAHMDPRLLHAFEFAHYLIFFMAMIFVLFTLVSMRGCLASKRQWDRAAAGSVHAICDAYIRRLQQGRVSCWSRLLRAVGLYEMQLSFSSEQQAIEWFILRVMFLREYGVSIHFDFSKYARKSLTNAIMRGVRITPATWAFMLCCLLLFAGADLVQRVDRSWEGTEAAEEASNPAVHVVVVGIVSWVALLLQLLLVLLLRQRQRLLLQRKLHILNYSEDLIPQLKENVQLMQMEAQEAESLGHDHLPARRESIDGDSSPRTGGLRLNFEGQTYSVSLQQRVLWLAHCTSMWSCFALAYYCMGLVVIIQRTGWSTVQQVVAHGALLLPHAILALRTSPALMKHEALLSCVVRRSDDIVATVASQMERYDDLRETLRCKLVDAHRQHQELLEDEPSTPTSAALLRLRLQASKTPEVQAMEFTALDVERAAGWLFQKIHGGDTDASSTGKLSVRKFRIGLHWINAYFTDSEWKALCRLLDPGHTLAIQLTDVLSVLRCGRGHDSADGFARTGGTGSEEDLESGGATPGGARVISPDQWMYEDVSSLDTEIEAIAVRKSSHLRHFVLKMIINKILG